MEWININLKRPPLYKEVLFHFNNGLICNGYLTDEEPFIDRHISLKHICGVDPEETTVVYWCEKPTYRDDNGMDKSE